MIISKADRVRIMLLGLLRLVGLSETCGDYLQLICCKRVMGILHHIWGCAIGVRCKCHGVKLVLPCYCVDGGESQSNGQFIQGHFDALASSFSCSEDLADGCSDQQVKISRIFLRSERSYPPALRNRFCNR